MQYRDHYPATDETRPAMRDAYDATRKLYERMFGAPDVTMWPAAETTCGDSYSGFIGCGMEKEAA